MTGSFVTPQLRQRVRGWAVPVARGLGRLGLSPNQLTLLGFAGTCAAAILAGLQLWLPAGILVVGFGLFDLLDGALARATGRVSRFGAFLDSTLDRAGENLVYVGIAYGMAVSAIPAGVALAGLALAFASLVTYARARAESLGVHGEVGFAPREVRLVVLGASLALAGVPGGMLGLGPAWLSFGLALIAALAAVTTVQRILHVRGQLRED